MGAVGSRHRRAAAIETLMEFAHRFGVGLDFLYRGRNTGVAPQVWAAMVRVHPAAGSSSGGRGFGAASPQAVAVTRPRVAANLLPKGKLARWDQKRNSLPARTVMRSALSKIQFISQSASPFSSR